MSMVQAHAYELHNQKESQNAGLSASSSHPLYAATERLMGALDRLEQKMQSLPIAPAVAPVEVFERENEALRTEHDKLNAAIADLKVRYDDLHQVASTIYNKLEDSIRRLTHIIEN